MNCNYPRLRSGEFILGQRFKKKNLAVFVKHSMCTSTLKNRQRRLLLGQKMEKLGPVDHKALSFFLKKKKIFASISLEAFSNLTLLSSTVNWKNKFSIELHFLMVYNLL